MRGLRTLAGGLLPMVYHPRYSFEPWPAKHRFRMSKFRDLHEHLLSEGIACEAQMHRPIDDPPDEWFTAVHDEDYYYGFCDGTLPPPAMRRIGFEWSPQLVERTRIECGGTVLAAQLALRAGLACNLAGGTHHAHRDFGSGFTILNDLAVTARFVQSAGLAERVLIVDLDVVTPRHPLPSHACRAIHCHRTHAPPHARPAIARTRAREILLPDIAPRIPPCDPARPQHQGDGTASIFAHDETVRTLSFHCGKNFPFRKSRSDVDIDVPVGTGDDAYMALLQATLPRVLKVGAPDLVLYDAGVDAAAQDLLGFLELSDEGLLRRDEYVLRECVERRVPVVTVIGGGYSADLAELARRHAIVFRAAQRVWAEPSVSDSGHRP
jgi:acetoin utilization deacetylase AcuC-like enzyme